MLLAQRGEIVPLRGDRQIRPKSQTLDKLCLNTDELNSRENNKWRSINKHVPEIVAVHGDQAKCMIQLFDTFLVSRWRT